MKSTPRHHTYLGFTTSGYHNIHYVEWGESDNPNAVICVHGMSRNCRDFDYLAEQLVEHGMRVICPDMPGRGQSDWLKNPEDYNFPKMVGDLMSLIAHSGVKEMSWIGTSMGGLLGMVLASAANPPIKRLVLNDVGPYITSEPLRRILMYLSLTPTFSNHSSAKKFLSQLLSPFGPLTDEQLDHFTTHSFFTNDEDKLQLAFDSNTLKTFATDDVDLWPMWHQVQCPTLVIRGSTSEVLTRETAYTMCEKPGVTMIEFPGIGHAPALVSQEQIDAIVNWLI